jgi:ligand-binding SRPBCC domain-containing protein
MQFIATTLIEAPPERVFAFHELPDAVARLTPQWIRARVLAQPASLRPGTRTILDIRIAPFLWIRNEAVHTIYEPPFLFADRQERGPFRSWTHRHDIAPEGKSSRLTDTIELEPPFGILGRAFAPLLILPRLRKLFAYRHEVTRQWCER